MNKQSLNFYPFFLLFGKVMRTLSFLNLSYELIYDYRDEEIHDKERRQKDVNNEYE